MKSLVILDFPADFQWKIMLNRSMLYKWHTCQIMSNQSMLYATCHATYDRNIVDVSFLDIKSVICLNVLDFREKMAKVLLT